MKVWAHFVDIDLFLKKIKVRVEMDISVSIREMGSNLDPDALRKYLNLARMRII